MPQFSEWMEEMAKKHPIRDVKQATREAKPFRSFEDGTGKLLKTFTIPHKTSHLPEGELIRMTAHEYIASYNWVDEPDYKIYVPGCPPQSIQPSLPYKVENPTLPSSRISNPPKEPAPQHLILLSAILTLHHNFSLSSISLTTDRISLSLLLEFCVNRIKRPARINIDIIENTLFFSRWEINRNIISKGYSNQKCPEDFRKAAREHAKGLEGSSPHHRIVKFNLGGLDILMSYTVDSFIPNETFNNSIIEEEIAASAKGTESQQPKTWASNSSKTTVSIISKGFKNQTSFTNLAKVKVKNVDAHPNFNSIMPKLWLSNLPHLYIHKHTQGLFTHPPTILNSPDCSERYKSFEDKHQTQLLSFIDLIKEIRSMITMTNPKNGKFALVVDNKGKSLKLFERIGPGLELPKGARETCWKKETEKKTDKLKLPHPGSQLDEFYKYFFCMEDGMEYTYPGGLRMTAEILREDGGES